MEDDTVLLVTCNANLNWITNDLIRSEMSLVVSPILDQCLSMSQKPPYNVAQFDRTDVFREIHKSHHTIWHNLTELTFSERFVAGKAQILQVRISCVG